MLHHMLRAAAQRAFTVLDPYFKYVTMLLHGDGSALGSDTVTPFNADASTNAFNVTINGDARSNNFNPYQAGYYSNYFDGTDDFLSYASTTTLNFGTADFTVECWINLGNTTSSKVLVGGTATNAFGFRYGTAYLSNNGLSIYRSGVTDLENCSFTFAANTWYHVAVVRESNVIKFFVNGTQQTTSGSGGASYNFPTETNVRVGTSDIGAEDYIGNISNLRVTKSAVYTSNFTPSTTPLTAITNTSLLTCQSNRFIDNSTNAFTITVNGNTSIALAQPFTLPTSVATYGSGYFDGSGDYLTVSSSAGVTGTGAFTVEFWAYMTTSQSFSRPVSGGADQFTIDLSSDGVINYGKAGVNNIISSNVGKVLGCWCHIVIARSSGGTARIWANGVSIGTATDSNNYTAGTVYIGSTSVPNFYLTGYLSNLRITNTDVYGTSNTTITVPTTLLTAVSGTSLLTTQYNGAGNNNGFKDSSQNNFVITRNGNTTQGTFSPYGSNWSNYFDGTGDYLGLSGQPISTTTWTIEAWVFLTGAANVVQTIYSQATAGNANRTQVYFYAASGEPYFSIYHGSGANASSTTRISRFQWNHVVMQCNGSTVSFYVNGAAAGSTSYSSSFQATSGVVGRYITGDDFTGYISNMRITNTNVYSSSFTPSTTPLTAISGTQLLTCGDNRFIDDSTNNFTITKNGDVSVQRFSPFSPTTAYSTSVIGGSGYFDGSGDYLSAGDQTAFEFGSGDFTISAWVYLTSFASTCTIASKYVGGDVNASEFVLWVTTGGNIGIALDGGGGEDYVASSAGTVTLNQWQHIVASKSGTTVRLFLNGTQVASGTSSRTLNSTGTALTIGGIGSGSLLTGYMSGLCIQKGIGYSTVTVPTAPITPPTNTSLLLSYTNAGILDNAMMNDLETVGNAQISTSVKKYGAGSMRFDGSGDKLFSPYTPINQFGSGNFTIEYWVYFNSVAADQRIVSGDANAGGTLNWCFYTTNSGTLNYYISFDGTNWNIAANLVGNISTGQWYHVALVRNGSTFTPYLNGTSGTTGTNSSAIYATTTGITVGAINTGSYFNGYIDDLRITKGVARYTSNFTAPTAAFPNN